MKKSDIAKLFSNGDFSACYEYLTAQTLWETPGVQTLKGIETIKAYCEKVRAYFDSVTTDFRQLNMIESENAVVVQGTATFIRDEQVVSEISSCDVYTFAGDLKIISIYSYCIKRKL